MSSSHSLGRSTIWDYTYWPTYRRAAQRFVFTLNAHKPRLGKHMSSAHSPGRRTIRNYIYWPTYRRAAHTILGSDSTCRAHIVPAGPQSGTTHIGQRTAGQHAKTRFGQNMSSAHSPGRSTIRDYTYWPTYRRACLLYTSPSPRDS